MRQNLIKARKEKRNKMVKQNYDSRPIRFLDSMNKIANNIVESVKRRRYATPQVFILRGYYKIGDKKDNTSIMETRQYEANSEEDAIKIAGEEGLVRETLVNQHIII